MAFEYLFVYGTLCKQNTASQHHLLVGQAEFVARGMLRGTLYEVCGYPGAIESDDSQDKIEGEVYKMLNPKPLLAKLDEYEECGGRFPLPHEYSRKQLAIELYAGDPVVAWVYLYNFSVATLQKIASGDYQQWIKHDCKV